MKVYFLSGLLIFSFSLPAKALNSRQYFDQLRSKTTSLGYKGKYVCFPDENIGGFSVLSKTKNIEDRRLAAKYEKTHKPLIENFLVEQFYTNGEPSEKYVYKRVDKNLWLLTKSFLERSKGVYKINWSTGRYRLLIYAKNNNSRIPSYVENGDCHLIKSMSKRH